jgi:hypothetical protein
VKDFRNRGEVSKVAPGVYPKPKMTHTHMMPTPSAVAPMPPMPHMAPSHVAGYATGPTMVAPTREVVNPTRVLENHSVVRYPIRNVYPTHVRNIRHHVCEYYCDYPYSESVQDCYHVVDHCRRPGFGPR